ncbi:MAG: hypothetical protein GQ548_02210 [Methylophaga sp.]|nr:hypothetical protein [Methylophaga sp.]
MNYIIKIRTELNDLIDICRYFINRFFCRNSLQKKIEKEVEAGVNNLVDGNNGIVEIVEAVKKNGYIILPNVLSKETLDKIRSEFRTIIDLKSEEFYAVDRQQDTVCVRMKPFFKIKYSFAYPAIYAFYDSSVFRAITKLFYADCPNGFDYVSELFVHETPETETPISGKLHWDRAQTLKYWIYLDDLPDEAGPMLIEPGSVEKNKNIRIDAHKVKNELIGGIDNIVEEPINELIPLSAGAGSIMIHDTDASHGASRVMPGYVRRIIRGHCRARM